MEKALRAGADALILDLEDSVAPAAKSDARRHVSAFLRERQGVSPRLFVRVNPLDSGQIELDLDAVASGRPDGIVLPKAEGADSIRAIDARLAMRDLLAPILPIATETAAAVFRLGTYASVASRLCGLTWGAEDLPAAIGATSSREENGRYTPPYEMVRAMTLFGSHAAEVPAIETVYPGFNDEDGLAGYVARAARDGFTGMMAIHPKQVAAINRGFTPPPDVVAKALAIIEAFEANPDAGALQVNGSMVDAPHLKQARRLIARAQASAGDASRSWRLGA
jgi:citrate lyase subunit beta/citryl-CoA lyase